MFKGNVLEMFRDSILELPWWQDAINLTKEQWRAQPWQIISTPELTKRINDYPLTSRLTRNFLTRHVSVVRLFESTIIYPVSEPMKFEILLKRDAEHEDKPVAFLHEICHGVYRVGGYLFGIERNDLIEKEAKRFFKEHRSSAYHLINCCSFYESENSWELVRW